MFLPEAAAISRVEAACPSKGDMTRKTSTRFFISITIFPKHLAEVCCMFLGRGDDIPGCRPLFPSSLVSGYYLPRVKSALPSPETVTGLDWLLAPSCHATTV